MKFCPACTSHINVAASRCPFCRALQPDATPLHRGLGQRMGAGVCAGIGYHLGVDPVLVRVIFVAALVASAGLAAGAYLLMWVVMPADARTKAPLALAIDWVTALFTPKRAHKVAER